MSRYLYHFGRIPTYRPLTKYTEIQLSRPPGTLESPSLCYVRAKRCIGSTVEGLPGAVESPMVDLFTLFPNRMFRYNKSRPGHVD